jgi:aspartyl-tRNA(Asn)/glutamyl-tRNA(Gln) amidotransferase subunit A
MITGKGFDEATILRLGYAYEQATDWHRRTPDVSWAA